MASISRQAGGLFWAVRSLSQGIQASGWAVHVFTGKDKYTDYDQAHWGDIPIVLIERWGPAAFGYLPRLGLRLREADVDILHVHGLWMYPSAAVQSWAKQTNRPYIVSPHGMLDAWALKNSRWKKRIIAILYENSHLHSAACIHALCEAEYHAIRAYGLPNPVAVIPNGVDLPDLSRLAHGPSWADDLPADSNVLIFLGRIHPKKGLINLLNAWAQVRRKRLKTSTAWYLVIAGWEQNGHLEELQQLSEALGLGESIRFVGPQFDEQKAASLIRADAFILPSFSEGLPMAVLEAWSYRLPVLMTLQCNLPEGFNAGAGIEMAPELASIAEALMKLFDMQDSERLLMGGNGRRLVEERYTWPTVVTQMAAVYSWMLGQGVQPDCVITN